MDLDRVMKGAPWTFNNHLLIIHRLFEGGDPLKVPLIFVPFQVQVHDVPPRFLYEVLVKQLGNFIGRFLKYDIEGLTRREGSYMHIRVCMDIQLPLKRNKRLLFHQETLAMVFSKYERLILFCFFCDKLGHNDSFCQDRMTLGFKVVEMDWDPINQGSIEMRHGNEQCLAEKQHEQLAEERQPNIRV